MKPCRFRRLVWFGAILHNLDNPPVKPLWSINLIEIVLLLCGLGFVTRMVVGLVLRRMQAPCRDEDVKSAVLDALAHDVKTPLTSIKASVSALLAQGSFGGKDRELLAVISDETDSLERIVNESIEIARIQLLDLKPERRCYDVRQTVEAALCDLNPSSGGRLRAEIPEGLPPLSIDFRLIKLVLRQLVDNALKYSPEHFPVVISARERGGKITFFVKDRGAGIPAVDQRRVFRRHYRGGGSGNGALGMGMGLAIAKRIINAHGGDIGVTSVPGKGCMFYVSLPSANGRA